MMFNIFFRDTQIKKHWKNVQHFFSGCDLVFGFSFLSCFFYASMRTLPITSATTLRLTWQIYPVRLTEGVCAPIVPSSTRTQVNT